MEIFLNAWIEREDGDFFGNSQSSRSIDRFLRKSTHAKYSNVHAPPVKG